MQSCGRSGDKKVPHPLLLLGRGPLSLVWSNHYDLDGWRREDGQEHGGLKRDFMGEGSWALEMMSN